ncbi:MAG: CDP-alcohol phosphatidyltransferase family protein [Oscillospiraceae bacterium]|jgi:CDP-diacylglycerol--glycerol-3-phosphate 3-phosphatidyltransferase|nr:CDP-alcohol phosphatidyltransferase family protein [Oscillospiraceae bacterium]
MTTAKKRNSLPNILSGFRIFLVPVFFASYFLDESSVKWYAVCVYALAGVTDFLDGFIARRYGIVTRLGKVLDPLGDKLMTVSALLCITIDRVIPVWAVLVAFIKEAMMGIGGLIIHRKKVDIPPSNILGKISTVVFVVVCLCLMLFPAIPARYAAAMVFIAIAIMFMALGSYVLLFIYVVSRRKKAEPRQKEG